jgi:epoxyqueuosine reductase
LKYIFPDSGGFLQGSELREHIIQYCRETGADLVGFAPVERWDEYGEVPEAFRPRALWAPARTVIVLGIEMPLPVVETTPSVLHMELYRTVNRELDRLAVNLTRHLNRLGHASFFFTRDGFSSLKALREKNLAAFSHVMAAKYAGLGTVGVSHCLLTPEFGPRVRLVSVFTEATIPGDAVQDKELCIKCGLCALCCPKECITMREDGVIGDYDKTKCLAMAEELTAARCYPCGTCVKVCPVGRDRLLYKQKGMRRKYLQERELLKKNSNHPHYRSWQHIRKYGVTGNPTKK